MSRFLKRVLLAIAKTAVRIASCFLLPAKNPRISAEKVRRILVYGQMGIGNMIMFTPFLKALRSGFPDSEITVLLMQRNGSEQVIAQTGMVNDVLIWDYRRMSYLQRLRAIRRLVKWKPDLIVSKFADYPIDYLIIALLSRPPYRVGHVTGGDWHGKYDYINNIPVKMEKDEHEIDRHLDLARAMGIAVRDKKTFMHVTGEDELAAGDFLNKNGISEAGTFLTMQIGTSSVQSWKRWSMERWAKLAEMLIEAGLKIVAVGSSGERKLIEETFARLAVKPVNAAGELTLNQTAALIKRSSLLVCCDSGLMHVGVAVDTPVVAIYGMGHYKRNAPLDKKHVIIRKDLPCSPCVTMEGTAKAEACRDRICLSRITVEEVYEAAMKQLDKGLHRIESK